jgi:transposase-like protein
MGEQVTESKPFRWDERRTRAALLLAEDSLSNAGIANTVGVSEVTLWKWRQQPDFKARVTEHVQALDRAVSRYSIAKRRERIRILDEQMRDLLAVKEARAEKYVDECPGGGTGLLVKQVKIGGGGENVVVIDEYVIDGGLIAELRALQKQAAQELGQWSDKATVNHTGGIRREIVVITESDTGPIDVTDEASFASIEADLDQLRGEDPYPEDAL